MVINMEECIQQKSKISEHTSETCIFCKIIKGEIPCAKIYEDDKIISFLDIAPTGKGHALVVPKEHYETLIDLPEEFPFLSAVKKVARAQSAALGTDGFNLVINNKRSAGQVVSHVHAHIIPRQANDGVFFELRHRKATEKEIADVAEKISKFL
jgi:histidine triad (HIT) family protein